MKLDTTRIALLATVALVLGLGLPTLAAADGSSVDRAGAVVSEDGTPHDFPTMGKDDPAAPSGERWEDIGRPPLGSGNDDNNVVPEPGALTLLGLGLASLELARRRRRNRKP